MSSLFPIPQSPSARAVHGPVRNNYELAWLDHDGLAQWQSRMLPSTPITENACAVLGRGALIETEYGHAAVEDLVPGDRLRTAEGGFETLRWTGARSYGEHLSSDARPHLFRVTAGSFSADTPNRDTILTAAASLLIVNPACTSIIGQRQAYAPLAAFEDGITVTRIQPPGEISVYNLALSGQSAVLVNGLAVQTYHPTTGSMAFLNENTLKELARVFPHLDPSTDFGPQRVPCLSMTEARMLQAQAS